LLNLLTSEHTGTIRYNGEIARRRCKSAEAIENRPLMLATAS
jgi:hypothetical protein